MYSQGTVGGGFLVGLMILLIVVGGACYYYYDHQDQDNDPNDDGYTPIATVQELMEMGDDGKYKLICDVDVSTIAWVPIDEFEGELDGRGFKIIGLNLDNNDSSLYVGLFRVLSYDGYVHDILFEDVNITSSHSGAVAGTNEGTIENVSVAGFVGRSNGVSCGGIAGTNKGEISGSQNYSTVEGQENIGGICGLNSYGKVQNCTNYGTVSGAYQDSGGIVGYSSGKILMCENQGTVESSGNRVGGICGATKEYDYCLTNDSTNRGRVLGSDYVGGCIGASYSDVSNLQNYGDVMGKASVGGTFGYVSGGFVGCSAPDQRNFIVEGIKNVGGFIGYCKVSFTGMKLNGPTVIGSQYVGGLVGNAVLVEITNCEFRGTILSKSDSGSDSGFGGIAGIIQAGIAGPSRINNCMSYANLSIDGGYAGGIVGCTSGYNFMYIENCSNYGRVEATGDHSAGIVGGMKDSSTNYCVINYCTNEGSIYGSNHVDGIGNDCSSKGKGCSNTGSVTSIES